MYRPAHDAFFRDKTLLPGQGHATLAHEHAMLTLVLHGRLDEEFPDGVQRCARWELHFKPAGAPHATRTGPAGVRMFLLGMRASALEGLVLPDRPLSLGGGVPAARALAAFLPFVGLGEQPRRIDREAVLRLTACLERQTQPASTARPTWITEAHEHVRCDGSHRTTLEGLSLRFRAHPVIVARAFRKYYGTSVGALRRRVRADRAIVRLLRGHDALTDLALDLGYADQSHFTREFKRETGWSPGRFRAATATWGRLPHG